MYSHRRLTYLALVPLLALVAVFAVAACGDDEEETLKIGVVLPETGALAAYGLPMIKSVELAEEDIKGGGGAIEVIYADSGTDPDKASESVNRLLGEGAHVIVGAAASGVSQAIIQTLYDENIPSARRRTPHPTSPARPTRGTTSAPPPQMRRPLPS